MVQPSATPSLDSLVDLACRDGVDIRPTLLRVLTDLYVQKPAHTAEEEIQYVELAQRLIEAVDEATRATVATRLAKYTAAPAVLLRSLAATAPPPANEAAERPAAGPDLVELFFAAAPEERRLILANLDVAGGTAARRPLPAAGEVMRRLENAALQHNAGEFSRTLERTLGISRVLAERIVHDASGEPLVVAAKALGLPAAMLQRILLFLNPAIGQSVERVYDLARLYDEIAPAAAARMLAIWRQASGQTPGRYEPATWDDERQSARALATPSPRRAARTNARQPLRAKADGRA
jgi:Uncharacterised protein conserved in bacteria (DUF2336)